MCRFARDDQPDFFGPDPDDVRAGRRGLIEKGVTGDGRVPSRPTAEVQVRFIIRVAGFGIRRRSTADAILDRHAQAGHTTAIKQSAGKNGVQVKKVKRVAHACPISGSVRKTRPVHNRRCPNAGGRCAHSASGPLRRSRSTLERTTPRGYILAPELTDHGRPHRTPWADCRTESHPVPVINRD